MNNSVLVILFHHIIMSAKVFDKETSTRLVAEALKKYFHLRNTI